MSRFHTNAADEKDIFEKEIENPIIDLMKLPAWHSCLQRHMHILQPERIARQSNIDLLNTHGKEIKESD